MSDSLKTVTEQLLELLGDDSEETPKSPETPAQPEKTEEFFAQKPKPQPSKIEVSGQPIMSPIHWDDLGLGLVRFIGFLPGRNVTLKINKDKWELSGALADNSVVAFIVGGAGGLVYFLQDIISRIDDWGAYINIAVVLIPTIMSMVVRVKKIEFYPFEVEFFGYDPATQILVISTLTQPGGLLPLKLNLPSNPRTRKIVETELMTQFREAHGGFMKIDGQVRFNSSTIKTWSWQALIWAIIIVLAYSVLK